MQISMIKSYLEAKLGQRGVAMVEYAILLAFVAVIAVAFLSNDGLSSNITAIIDNIKKLLGVAASNSSSAATGAGAK